jgi:hypothetical protein
MEKKKLDWIIEIIRENMVVGAGGFTGAADPKGPTAGFDPVMRMTRRKKVIGLGKNSRNRWDPKKQSG